MAIAFTQYVNITSGVGGGAGVKTRDLIGRIFTSNALLPAGTMAEFETLADVGALFGTTSEEYKRASFYFGWVSKNTTKPQKLSFARWNAEALAALLTTSTEANNNFGSFAFIDTLTLAQVSEIAAWNAAQNVMYQFCQKVTAANAAAWSGALIATAGTSLTLAAPVANEYHELVPMVILAATRYDRRNSTQNYMYQQFALTPSVTDTPTSITYNNLRVNYYGNTQTAGQIIAFYQRGLMMGGATSPVDMNTYANEQWLKDKMGATIMSLLLSMPKISANNAGRAQLLSVIQNVIEAALVNGVISVGKALNIVQKVYVASMTGSDNAFRQIEGIGYWVDCVMTSYVTGSGATEWKADYTLLYAKDDTIRSVTGTHTLI